MKKLLSILLITAGFIQISAGQRIVKNETDEFTGKKTIHTDWKKINQTFKFNASFRLVIQDKTTFFDLKFMKGSGGKVFSVLKGQDLMLKTDKGTIVKLKCRETQMSCRGCGSTGFMGSKAQGVNVYYIVDQENAETLSKETVTKLRFYYREAYVEGKVSSGGGKRIKKAFNLIKGK